MQRRSSSGSMVCSLTMTGLALAFLWGLSPCTVHCHHLEGVLFPFQSVTSQRIPTPSRLWCGSTGQSLSLGFNHIASDLTAPIMFGFRPCQADCALSYVHDVKTLWRGWVFRGLYRLKLFLLAHRFLFRFLPSLWRSIHIFRQASDFISAFMALRGDRGVRFPRCFSFLCSLWSWAPSIRGGQCRVTLSFVMSVGLRLRIQAWCPRLGR